MPGAGTQRQRRLRPFYGWLMVLVAGSNGSFQVGAYFANSTLLLPMQADLGWSSITLLGVISLRTLLGGALGPLVGPIGDHPWLARVTLPVSTLLIGVSFLVVKWIDGPVAFYLLHGVLGGVAMAFTGNAIMEGIVVKWFVRKRAQALMWVNVGPATGPLLFPLIVTALLSVFGWRDTWLWLGIGTIAVLFPLALLVRPRPESMGLSPDGVEGDRAQDGPVAHGAPAVLEEVSLTRGQALRTRAFWTLVAAFALGTFGVQGYQVHWIPYMRESGFEPQTAALAVLVYGVFTVLARFFWGYFSARYSVRSVMMAQPLCAAAGVALLLTVQNSAMLFVWAVYQGITLAGFFQLMALISVNYFGREHIGAIRGAMWPISTAAAASSPLVLGVLHDWRDGYTLAFGLLVVTWAMAAVLVATTRSPQPQPSRPPA